MNRSWAPGYLGKWLFAQNRLWITAAGEAVTIRTMDRTHALNTLLMLERVEGDLRSEGALRMGQELQDTPLYAALYKRVAAREAGVPVSDVRDVDELSVRHGEGRVISMATTSEGIRIIVAYEKDGEQFINASTDEAWQQNALALLRQRFEVGYFYHEPGDPPARPAYPRIVRGRRIRASRDRVR